MTQDYCRDETDDHKELLDRARRTETKISSLIQIMGLSTALDAKTKCDISVRNGITVVTLEAADVPLSVVKSALITAGFDPRNNCMSVKLIVGDKDFGTITFD